MNRTLEFQTFSDSLSIEHGSCKPVIKRANHVLASSSFFASEISHTIDETTLKVKHLDELSKTTSPFENNTIEIDKYICIVKEDILTLQQNTHQLGETIDNSCTPNKQTSRHLSTMVDTLNNRLLCLTSLFKRTLETRTVNLKELEIRRNKATGPRANIPLNFQTNFDNYDEDRLNTDVVITIPSMIQMNDSFVSHEADQAREIEMEINNVQQIFMKLAEIVSVQGEKIRRIEEAMDETLFHGERAHNQLLQVYHNLESNRRLVMKMLGVVMFFVMVWILFFA